MSTGAHKCHSWAKTWGEKKEAKKCKSRKNMKLKKKKTETKSKYPERRQVLGSSEMPSVISLHEVNSFMTISCDDLPLDTPQVTLLPAQGSNSKQFTKTLIITPPKLLGCRQSFSLCKAHRLGTQSWLHSPVISEVPD